VLEVCDCFQSELDVKTGKYTQSSLVDVDSIVEDLVGKWAGNIFDAPPGSGPGIMAVANSAPSQAELEAMRTRQTVYFQDQYSRGQLAHNEARHSEITATMRLAAEWLGMKTIWSDPAILRDSKPCPFCTMVIPEIALVCPHCHRAVKAIPKELASLQPAGV
jgi:hypothetical protein